MELTDAQNRTIKGLGLEAVGRDHMNDDWCISSEGTPWKVCGRGKLDTSVVVRPALAARVKELEGELLRVRTTGHAAAHHLDNMAIEQGLGAALPPMEIADAIRRKIAALESELAPIRALKVGSAEWACYQMAMGHKVSCKVYPLGMASAWRDYEPFTLHTEPPPAPTADDLCAAIIANAGADTPLKQTQTWNVMQRLAAAYRAANAKGGV